MMLESAKGRKKNDLTVNSQIFSKVIVQNELKK